MLLNLIKILAILIKTLAIFFTEKMIDQLPLRSLMILMKITVIFNSSDRIFNKTAYIINGWAPRDLPRRKSLKCDIYILLKISTAKILVSCKNANWLMTGLPLALTSTAPYPDRATLNVRLIKICTKFVFDYGEKN